MDKKRTCMCYRNRNIYEIREFCDSYSLRLLNQITFVAMDEHLLVRYIGEDLEESTQDYHLTWIIDFNNLNGHLGYTEPIAQLDL